jgi:hypothetical protein
MYLKIHKTALIRGPSRLAPCGARAAGCSECTATLTRREIAIDESMMNCRSNADESMMNWT